ncbi:hypothetical protein FKM82_029613 [Ascaphus truei]
MWGAIPAEEFLYPSPDRLQSQAGRYSKTGTLYCTLQIAQHTQQQELLRAFTLRMYPWTFSAGTGPPQQSLLFSDSLLEPEEHSYSKLAKGRRQ